MFYEYQSKAGYCGTGAWVVYGQPDCFGYRNALFFAGSEEEAKEYIDKRKGFWGGLTMRDFEEALSYDEWRQQLIDRIYEGDKIYHGPNEYIDHREVMDHASAETWDAMHKALRAMANDFANPAVRDTGVARQQFLTAYDRAACELVDMFIDDIQEYERRQDEEEYADSIVAAGGGRRHRLFNRARNRNNKRIL